MEPSTAAPLQPKPEPGPALDELSRSECLALVETHAVGRIAVCQPVGSPLVVPVNYVLRGDVVVFRTGPGSKLTAARSQLVSFQVDDIDPVHHTGWSVLIQGSALVSDQDPSKATVEPWAPGDKRYWVRITPASITGRRITLAATPPDARAYL